MTPGLDAGRVRQEIQGRFNPIRGLTPDLLTKRLEAFKVGYLRELAITWDAMEARDINIKTVASKRQKAASRLQWDVEMVDDAPKGKAEKHRAALRFFYENLEATSVMESNQRGGVSLLVRQMMDAIGKRFACHEIVWKPKKGSLRTGTAEKGGGASTVGTPQTPSPRPSPEGEGEDGTDQTDGPPSPRPSPPGEGEPTPAAEGEDAQAEVVDPVAASKSTLLTAEFRFCPLWFFENRTGRLRFIPTAFGVEGVDMPDGDWLVTVGDGLMEATSVAYMFKQMSLKDWVSFSEKFGMPGVLGSTDASKGSEQWTQMEAAVAALMNDWAAVKNKGDEITLIETKGGASTLPFEPLVEYMDRKIAAIWRGADLSTISHQSSGQGTGASLQAEEEDLLLEDDAQLITETLNRQVDTFVIEYIFGAGTEPLAYFKLGTGREEFDDADFRRKVWLGFLADGTVNDVMANLVDLKDLTQKVGLPVNEEYIDPYLPVKDQAGNDVTGGTVLDPEGDIVGGESKEPALTPALSPRRGGTDASASANGNDALANDLMAAAGDRLAAAVRSDFRPVGERLQRILEIDDPVVLRDRLIAFRGQLPSLIRDVNADPESAKALEDAMAAALFNGLAGNKTAKHAKHAENGRPTK